jgi:hypothetical protein
VPLGGPDNRVMGGLRVLRRIGLAVTSRLFIADPADHETFPLLSLLGISADQVKTAIISAGRC